MAEGADKDWEWSPNYSLGVVILGKNIDYYLSKLHLIKDENEDGSGWIRYKLPSLDTFIDVENNSIVSISSFDEFRHKGSNLIGMPFSDMKALLNCTPDEKGDAVLFDNGDIQIPYDYYDLGLQIWVSHNAIVSASCIDATRKVD